MAEKTNEVLLSAANTIKYENGQKWHCISS